MGLCEPNYKKNTNNKINSPVITKIKETETGKHDSNTKLSNQNKLNDSFKIIKENKEICIKTHADPMTEEEMKDLYLNKSSMCKIIIKNKNEIQYGTGFFCEINDDKIPFKKALFTANHVLDENSIEFNKVIEIEYLGEIKKIQITNDRTKFTNKIFDYTCIEILNMDKINNFFRIDNIIFNNRNELKNQEIFILQYPKGKKLAHDCGRIIDIKKDKIIHSVSTKEGSSGAPLIKRYNNNLIVGIHNSGAEVKNNFKYESVNLATPIDIIIKDIKDQSHKNINSVNEIKNNEYKNIINIIYDKKDKGYFSNKIFGEKFVENNKDNIKLIINGKESKLNSKYNLNIGLNNIQIIIIKKLTNIEYMFYDCESLKNIEELKYLNTKEINNFSYMFLQCYSLLDIKVLQNWDVSNGNNFEGMFSGCYSLSDIKALQNWNVSNGKYFSSMFSRCSSLSDIKSLQNWNVSNGKEFYSMFYECFSLL